MKIDDPAVHRLWATVRAVTLARTVVPCQLAGTLKEKEPRDSELVVEMRRSPCQRMTVRFSAHLLPAEVTRPVSRVLDFCCSATRVAYWCLLGCAGRRATFVVVA